MPPKTKRSQSASQLETNNKTDVPTKRKRAIPLKHQNNSQLAAIHSSSNTPEINIDYDRLADAILRKQQEKDQRSAPLNEMTSMEDGTQILHTSESDVQPHTNREPSVMRTTHSHPITTQCLASTSTTTMPQTVSTSTVPVLQTHSCPTTQALNSDTPVPTLLNTLFGGESATVNEPQPLNFSNHIPLGATVSDKLKQKIWGDIYFDIKLLLPNQQEENFSVSIERGAINFQQGKFNKFSISLNQWTSAFIIFTAIYIQRKPLEAPDLLKYLYMIREMASTTRTDSWRNYDEEFRKLRQSSPLPWQEPLTELVLRSNLQSTATPSRFRQTNQPFQASQPFQPRARQGQGPTAKGPRFCYAYNQGSPCKYSPCQFRHACIYCKEEHPRLKCPKLIGTQTEGKQGNSKPTISNKAKGSKEVA